MVLFWIDFYAQGDAVNKIIGWGNKGTMDLDLDRYQRECIFILEERKKSRQRNCGVSRVL